MEFSHSEPVGICWLDTDTQRVFYLILVYIFDPALIFSICIKKELFSSPDNIWHISIIWYTTFLVLVVFLFLVCDANMYRCADDKANPVCLPQSSICNVVVECNKDEANCQGKKSKMNINVFT